MSEAQPAPSAPTAPVEARAPSVEAPADASRADTAVHRGGRMPLSPAASPARFGAAQQRVSGRARAASASSALRPRPQPRSSTASASGVPGGIAPPYVPPALPLAPAAQPVAPSSTAPADPQAVAPVAARDAARERGVDTRSVAALLFEQANGLRRDGQTRDAAARYRELGARFPQSAEARLSLVLLGRLELDHGDASAALARFDAYVATGEQALREQALAGRARALLRLDREAGACAAFADLLRDFPSSAYAPMARARCEKE
jgi:TolA-binding protein